MSAQSPREQRDQRPWYRQFWPWFLIALPMIAVIGGIVTLIIAVRSSDPLVTAAPPAAPAAYALPESDA
jgi:hypothetical protein